MAVTTVDHRALPQLRKAGHDDHACGALLRDLMPGAVERRGEGKRELVIDGGEGRRTLIRFNSKGRIKEILIPASLKQRLAEIIERAGRKVAKKVIRSTLLGNRQLDKYYRVGDWVQLRPVETVVLDQTMHQRWGSSIPDGRPHPFVLEVAYTSTPELSMFEAHRSMVALDEAKLLVAAFLEFPVHQSVSGFAWVVTPEHKIALVNCTLPHLDNAPDDEFSDIGGLQPLSTTDEKTYFKRGGVGVSTFEVPDMAALRAKYYALSVDDQARFLRACANLWDSGTPRLSDGSCLISSVSAIEAMLPEGERCRTCKAHIGMAKRFKAFVRRFAPTSSEGLLKLSEMLYPSRSLVAHGSWHDIVDQPMFGLMIRDAHVERLTAWHVSRVGAIGWLNGGGNSTAWWDDCENGSEP